MHLLQVIILGLIEGATEFIPVSSTGHLVLATKFLGFESPGNAFEVLIQFGAILAIVLLYLRKILSLIINLPSDPQARHFVLAVIVSFLPAAVVGALMHKYIKELFDAPIVICVALIVGGFILLAVDRMDLKPRLHNIMDFPLGTAFLVGVCQCLAMIPGVSRSGSTIVGAMLLGSDKRTAAEFSFFLAMPTMAGAFALDLYKNWSALNVDVMQDVAIGFVVSFLSAIVVVRYLLDYVSRHGFVLFAWWRVIVGGLGLGALLVPMLHG